MNGFLDQVAADLYGRYGDGISSLHMVLPNLRAGLFFGEALSAIIEKPLWQPAPLSVDSLAEELSGLATGEKLRLVVELYKIYSEFHPGESFDTFYFWGELLLGDFDSIDKYLIDADTLFSNLVDMHELDERFDYLSPEQQAVITKFWGAFSRTGDRSPEQHDFLRVWRTLAPVYHRFRARLGELGIAYQGMVYREAAQRILDGRTPPIPERHYVVAGFNALSKCERTLFDYLQKNFKVDFHWDYDEYYTRDTPLARVQEAGRFMRDDLHRFPPASSLPGGYDNFSKPKNIRSVAAASDVLQCKYAGLRLGDLARRKGSAPDKETAVVLCDESLLTPLLYSMPPEVDNVNVTMGYPLRMHPSYTFIERLLELQNRARPGRRREGANAACYFYHSDVEGLLKHPYLGSSGSLIPKNSFVYIDSSRLHTTRLLEKVFTCRIGGSAPCDWRRLSDYLIDVASDVAREHDTAFFALIIDHIRMLATSLEGCGIDISPKTYASLLRRSLQSVTVPFEGEPLAGVQVMGILETRALDFENIIFLSASDDTMPGNLTGAPSFIPYNLKMAYGLPTPEHHEGVYAYHFYRLIQRARNIDLVWSSSVDDRSTGEPSRYLLALDYESPHTVEKHSVTVDVNLSPREPVEVPKEPEKIPRRLSPSMFFTYVECPLKFYFRAVAKLAPDEEVAEEVDGAMFGNILHRAMQLLYTPLVGVPDPRGRIRDLIGSSLLTEAVSRAVRETYTHRENDTPEDWGGSVLLAHKMIVDYIDRGILPFDADRTEAYTIERLEEKISAEFEGICFAGIADRIDRLADGSLRVVDYKTGSPKNNTSAVLQMKLYAMMLGADTNDSDRYPNANLNPNGAPVKIAPELYYVRDMSGAGSGSDYSPPAVELDASFEDELRATLVEMFDPAVPFTQTPDPKPCEWCDFAPICRR